MIIFMTPCRAWIYLFLKKKEKSCKFNKVLLLKITKGEINISPFFIAYFKRYFSPILSVLGGLFVGACTIAVKSQSILIF